MSCFNCKYFSDGKDKNCEKLNYERGYCRLHDQEYWRWHDSMNFFAIQNEPNTKGTSLKESFFDIFKSKKRKSSFISRFSDKSEDSILEKSDCINEDSNFIVKMKNSSQNKRLETIQKNITIDNSVFEKYGISFKCNLIEDSDVFQLNFELYNTKGVASKISRDDYLIIKVNAYDAKGNLLCIEEEWISYNQLKSGYVADYTYFPYDSMNKAHLLRVYAIDPSDSDNEDDTCDQSDLLNQIISSRFNEIIKDSLKLLETTFYPQTYFGRYETAFDSAIRLAEATYDKKLKSFAEEVIEDLTKNRTKKIKSFIDRCNNNGRLYLIKEELLSGEYDLPIELKTYIESLIQNIETEEEVPESGEYIYCSLSFSPGGKTYYYKTTDETLKCGDDVIVLVGADKKKSIAKIVKIEKFAAGKTPYPPSKTKDILGKCPY